ncbi:MAG: lysylphosphatidylglycerol synthase transmembrane domain-containing protein [Patescibacteria group bacterium]
MKKAIKFLVAFGLGLLIFYLVIQRSGVETLGKAANLFFSVHGVAIIGITLLIWFLGVLRWKIILGCQGERRKFTELMGVWSVSYSIDYLTPVAVLGGGALRIYLTKKILHINWEKGLSSAIIDKILDITFHSIFLVAGVAMFLSFGNFPEFWIFGLVIASIFILVIGLTLFYSRAIGKKSILLLILNLFGLEKTQVKATKNGEFIFNTEGNVLRFFSPKKSFFWKGVVLSFFRHILFYTRALLIVLFIVGVFSPLRSLAVHGLANLSMMLPLPAGLGGLEAISSFGFKALELGFENGTVFGMTWRSADLIVCILGIIFGIKIAFKLFELKTFNFIDRIKKS